MSAARAVSYTGLVVLGAVVGAAGSLVQGGWVPGGLLLALAGTAGLFYGGLRLTGTTVGVGAAAAGWLVAVVVLSLGRPEGDGVFAGGIVELVYLLGGMAVAVICATAIRTPPPGGPPSRQGS
ncbi:DUF6113 family protein [Streptomyces sp. NPDC093595]|uniref:DUF6113 family protein n=1 Tax=Streptomyces sp. NPDC093595 TaxID=3366045 RepID=UPI0038043CAC